MIKMKENYYALMVAILKPCTPEQAFELMKNSSARKKHINVNPEVLIFHKNDGMTYKEIGEMFGITDCAVYIIIKRYKQKFIERLEGMI